MAGTDPDGREPARTGTTALQQPLNVGPGQSSDQRHRSLARVVVGGSFLGDGSTSPVELNTRPVPSCPR